MQTRGQRNNNPLNIRRSADRWKGARTEQTDKNFVQFETMAYGYRAAWKVLESYWKHFCGKCEAYSVRNIIGRWAPPDENDTENYIRTVVKLSGLGGNENFPQPSRGECYERLELLVRAMTTVECGIPYREVDVTSIREGFDLAFPGRRKVKKRRKTPETPVDAGVSQLPHMKGTTFGCWDEYWDW